MSSKRCLYDILRVEATASTQEIRSAYHTLALKWHPDKLQQSGASAEACQEATVKFQQIVHAYAVLSNPSERSRYDFQRTHIRPSSDFDLDLQPFLSPSAFAGYGDTGKGFYAVYNGLFTKLHQKEVAFAHAHGVRRPSLPPDMGNLSTPYPQVLKFYDNWLTFSTVKDFAWCDKFQAMAGLNQKLQEEENKKTRAKARKEFNEAVWRLVIFVKNNDRRLLDRQKHSEKEEEMRKEAGEKRSDATQNDRDSEEADDFDVEGGNAWDRGWMKSSGWQVLIRCKVCSKKFKSEEQWWNHERSKKHRKMVKRSLDDAKRAEALLRRMMADFRRQAHL